MLSHIWLCDSMDCSSLGSSVHGILQAGILEWVTISSSRGTYRPRHQTCLSCIGRRILYHRAAWEYWFLMLTLSLMVCDFGQDCFSFIFFFSFNVGLTLTVLLALCWSPGVTSKSEVHPCSKVAHSLRRHTEAGLSSRYSQNSMETGGESNECFWREECFTDKTLRCSLHFFLSSNDFIKARSHQCRPSSLLGITGSQNEKTDEKLPGLATFECFILPPAIYPLPCPYTTTQPSFCPAYTWTAAPTFMDICYTQEN